MNFSESQIKLVRTYGTDSIGDIRKGDGNDSSVVDGITVSDSNSVNVAVEEPTYVVPGFRPSRAVLGRIQRNRDLEMRAM